MTTTNNNNTNDDKQVQWGHVQIYEFPLILGDNPSVTSGAPLTIAWRPQHQDKLAVHDYETKRSPRHRSALRLSAGDRYALLLRQGVTVAAMVSGTEEVDRIRKSRQLNRPGRGVESFKKVWQNATKRFGGPSEKRPSLSLAASTNRMVASKSA